MFRSNLRSVFNVPPPPFTDGDIPIVCTKIDEFILSLNIAGLKIKQRYFPRLYWRKHDSRRVVAALKLDGFNFLKPVYILCESASARNREWGVRNFVKLAKLLTEDGVQVIVSSMKRSKKKKLDPYLRAGIRSGLIFSYQTDQLLELFALLGLNQHFQRNLITGIVLGDTGVLHIAEAANNQNPPLLRPRIVCLGHNSSSGDIRYADPGTIYIARLRSTYSQRLVKAVQGKMKMFNRSDFPKIPGVRQQYISIDRPAGRRYLIQTIPDQPDVLPIFYGDQIYGHTLLRNIFNTAIRPLSEHDRVALYRRMHIWHIEPLWVYRILNNFQDENIKILRKGRSLSGVAHYSEDIEGVRKIENIFSSEEALRKYPEISPKPIYFFRKDGEPAYFLSSKLRGKRLIEDWPMMAAKEKKKSLVCVLSQLKLLHSIRQEKFGKQGVYSSLLYSRWEDYFGSLLNVRIEEVARKKLLEPELVARVKEFIRRHLVSLRSSRSSLVHHDIKLDNILATQKGFSFVDFEYATYAPIDYELDTLFRSFDDPEIYFGQKYRYLNKDKDLIRATIQRYYPQMMEHEEIATRLTMYSMKFYLDNLVLGRLRRYCRNKIRGLMG